MKQAGIVGCGSISGVHGQVLSQMPQVRIAACADIVPERAQAAAQRYGCEAYPSLEEMLDGQSLDVLHICTPHYLHVPMAVEALNRGISVVMEKPAAISWQQMEQLKAAARGKHLAICFQNRYNPAVVEMKEILSSGRLGRVKGARAFVTWSRDEAYYTQSGWRGTWATEGGGVLINQSIHTLDLLTYLLGRPHTVEATCQNHHLKGVIEVEDTAEIYMAYADKCALFYATTAYCADSPVLLEIMCEKGSLRMEGEDLAVTREGQMNLHTFERGKTVGKNCWGDSHQRLIGDFYRSLDSGEPFPAGLESVMDSFAVLMAAFTSHRQGQPVSLSSL